MTAPGGGRTDPTHKVATPRIVRELPEGEITIAKFKNEVGPALSPSASNRVVEVVLGVDGTVGELMAQCGE